MSLHWFRPDRVGEGTIAEVVERLAPFGIELKPRLRQGCVAWRDVDSGQIVRSIGSIAACKDGRIVVWPFRDTLEAEIRVLLGSTERAVRKTPTRADAWLFRKCKKHPAGYWRTVIVVGLENWHAEHRAVAAALPESPLETEVDTLSVVEDQVADR